MAWYHRLLNTGRTARVNREIDRELAFHIAETADALRASGMSEEAALREARRRLGNATLHRERTRDMDVVGWLETLVRDVRHALRGLVNAPVFAAVAVLSLALGIGANTAIFTLIEAVVLRSLPVPNPQELVLVGMASEDSPRGERIGFASFTNPLWEQIRDRQSGFVAMAAFAERGFNTAAGGEPRRLEGAYVSGEYFRLFGVQPAVGRLIGSADDVRGCAPTAVLGYGHWEREFARDRSVVGRTLVLEGVPFEIVGVAGPGFSGAQVGRETLVYVPVCAEAVLGGEDNMLDRRTTWWLMVVGRREPQVGMEEAGARLAAISPAVFAATVPEGVSREMERDYLSSRLTLSSGAKGLSSLREQYGTALLLLMTGVGLVLLVACANVANLLLARATAREREFAIRAAIGAGRARLVRQLVTESLLLALLGAVLGMLLARIGTRALVALIEPMSEVIALDLSLNARILGFTTAVAVVTALLFGLVPAWRASRADPHTAMTARARSIAEGSGRFTLGKTLVAAQVGLSMVLLAGAGLLIGSWRNLTALDPGFTSDGVLTARVDVSPANLEPEAARSAYERLLERVRALPGVRAASSSAVTPVGGLRWNDFLVIDGYTPQHERDGLVWFNEVSDNYFATLDTRVIAGRDFEPGDARGAPLAAIVTEAVAQRYYEGNAIGKTFRLPTGDDFTEPYTIIGVVEDAKYSSLREDDSETVFVSAAQAEVPEDRRTLELRTDGDPAVLIPGVKEAVAEIDPAITVEFATLSDQVAQSLQRERTLAVLSAVFGGLALALAVLGLYGVMAYTVARRRNEIGVRIALGADATRVLRMVLGDAARVLAIGLAAGVVGAAVTARLVTSFLFGLSPAEPSVLAGAAALLAAAALAAATIPAWRASRMNPTSALREE